MQATSSHFKVSTVSKDPLLLEGATTEPPIEASHSWVAEARGPEPADNKGGKGRDRIG